MSVEVAVADAPRIAAADDVRVVLVEPGIDPATESVRRAGATADGHRRRRRGLLYHDDLGRTRRGVAGRPTTCSSSRRTRAVATSPRGSTCRSAPSLSTVVDAGRSTAPGPRSSGCTRLADSGLRSHPGAGPCRRGRPGGRGVGPFARARPSRRLRSPVTIADTGSAAHVAGGASVRRIGRGARRRAPTVVAVVPRCGRAAPAARRAVGVVRRRSPSALVVAVVGAAPFDLDEIESFLAESVGVNAIVGLPVDELAAAVFGGRTGVSERRLARLPLIRAAHDLALVAERSLPGVDRWSLEGGAMSRWAAAGSTPIGRRWSASSPTGSPAGSSRRSSRTRSTTRTATQRTPCHSRATPADSSSWSVPG